MAESTSPQLNAALAAGHSTEPAWRRFANLLVILLGAGAGGLSFGVIGPVLRPMSQAVGGVHLAQIIIVMPLLGLAVGGLVAGWVAERLGVRRTILAGGAAFGLSGLAAVLHPPTPLLIADAFLIGASAAILRVGTSLLLANRYSGDARARVIGYATASGSLISAGAVWLSGLIAEVVGWAGAFLQFGVAGGLIAICTLLAVPPARAARDRQAQPVGLRLMLPVTPLFGAVFAMMLVATTTNTHMPLLLAEEGVASTAVTSSVMSMQGLFAMLAALAYGTLQVRFGKLAIAVAGVALFTASGVIAAAAHSPVMFGAACAAMGAGVGLMMPYMIDTLLARAPVAARARALGFFGTSNFVGGFLNPFVARPISEAVGLHGLYLTIALFTALAGAAFLLVAAGVERSTQRPS
jgi:MFS family permease